MFWFQHPRPPNRKEVAEQVVARKQTAPDVTVLIVETPVKEKLPPVPGRPGDDVRR
jgi:hypothetical protein